jgi:hypothetical protein
MKGLKKIALASAVAAVSAGAQAELKALDDSALGELTGQAGLTIDVETSYTLGEFQYKDAGSVFLTGLSLGGNTNTAESGFAAATGNASSVGGSYLDNYRIYIDIAGDGTDTDLAGNADNNLNYGFSRISDLAAVHVAAKNADTDILNAALATVTSGANASVDKNGLEIDGRRDYDDGDLVIHFSFTDAWQKGGGFGAYGTGVGTAGFDPANLGKGSSSLTTITYDQALDVGTRAVDFNFTIDAIGIADSDFVTGETTPNGNGIDILEHQQTGLDSDATTTVLISGLSINGYLGPADLHIENNGNGFGADGSGLGGALGSGNADSKIIWGSYFRVTDLDVYIDIAGVALEGIEIKNTRGDLTGLDTDGTGGKASFGFAHSERTIYAVKDAVLDVGGKNGGNTGLNNGSYVDGLALNTRFKGDIDIAAIKFGDTDNSIGSLFLTDMESDTKWTISAH